MKKFFGNLLIKQKLTLIIMLTSLITMSLALVAFSAKNLSGFRTLQKNRFAILAEILANNSQAALSFNDQKSAEELLNALKAETHVQAAVIFDAKGKIFAQYRPSLTALPPQIDFKESHFYTSEGLHTYFPVTLDNQIIGEVYIQSDLEEFRDYLRSYALFGILILLACLAAALFIASRLQRTISVPITNLTQLAESVSRDKDYSLRAVKENHDELGNLVDRFNEMLSEIQKRQEALVRSNEALSRSNRDLEQFAYVASHDLQEPLRMVVNYVDLLTLQWKDTSEPEVRQSIGYITEGAKRSQQLIKDLLEYSKVRSESKFETISSEEIFKGALENLQYTIETTEAQISHAPLPMIVGDPIKIKQVFQNLLGNALKFRRKEESPKIHVNAYKKNGDWTFSIQDNGIGIDQEYSERIFVIFKRLHTREDYPGTGIGLAICKKIIEQHGGKIWVESKPNEGSTFYFTVPVIHS